MRLNQVGIFSLSIIFLASSAMAQQVARTNCELPSFRQGEPANDDRITAGCADGRDYAIDAIQNTLGRQSSRLTFAQVDVSRACMNKYAADQNAWSDCVYCGYASLNAAMAKAKAETKALTKLPANTGDKSEGFWQKVGRIMSETKFDHGPKY